MRKTWAITVDVGGEEYFSDAERNEELEYWSATIDNAIESVLYNYRKQRDRLQYNADYTTMDFTTITAETKP